ncbi:hypothetical protein [Solidesulfovibrio aerotolerans]|nr:hypothetical protein [Solidesulfovibrio aerotolerans]
MKRSTKAGGALAVLQPAALGVIRQTRAGRAWPLPGPATGC